VVYTTLINELKTTDRYYGILYFLDILKGAFDITLNEQYIKVKYYSKLKKQT